jgi:dolichol kinase
MNQIIKDEFLRKLIHLSSLWMVVFIAWFGRDISIILFGVLLGCIFLFEYARMTYPPITQFINRNFGIVMRDFEKVEKFSFSALTGSFYFVLSVFISLILFEPHIAIIAILIMILSDTSAALIGKIFGRHPLIYFQKSIEGCAAFFITTCLILVMMAELSMLSIIVISAVLTCVECISNRIRVNDNLSITLMAGLLLTLSI